MYVPGLPGVRLDRMSNPEVRDNHAEGASAGETATQALREVRARC
jgi:hypothetical protein